MKFTQKKRLLICVITAAAVFLLAALWEQAEKAENNARIKRNAYGGGTKKQSFYVQPEGEAEEEITVEIQPREYTENELKSLFEQASRRLDKEVIGKNESPDYIETNLSFPEKLSEFPFTITWELSRYDIINMTGELQPEELKRLDENRKGILLTVTAILRYKDQEFLYSTEVHIFAKVKVPGLKDRILELVQQADESTKEKAYFDLPLALDGKKLRWSKAESSKLPALFILGAVGTACFLLMERQKKEQKKRKRMEQMLCDYPQIISQFTMLMGAGLTVKNTWKKVVEVYSQKKKTEGKTREVYEEMSYTWQEMISGVTEAEAYERFARRCGLTVYMKFGALLAHNLKKGTKGTADSLRAEAMQALEERKSRAKRLGEEAGTKLLGPMFLMLAVVMAIIIIPAFWSIQF